MLWSSRNETNAGESTRAPKIMAGLILKHYVDTQQLTKSNTNPNTVQSKWRRPPLEFLKINVDGSYVEANKIGGWAFIVRDHVGSVVGSEAGRIEHYTDAMHAEAMATLHALSFASEAGMSRLVLETDAINIKTALTSQIYDLSPIGMVIKDIKCLMFTEFTKVRVVLQPRSCNLVADRLAKFGCQLDQGAVMIWPDGNPAFVNDEVVVDSQLASV